MTYQPARYCKRPGCRGVVRDGTCSRCGPTKRKRAPDKREGSAKRGYNYRWQRVRKVYLAANPLCERCRAERIDEPATIVHHKIRHGGNSDLLFDEENMEGLCKRHHDQATGRGE